MTSMETGNAMYIIHPYFMQTLIYPICIKLNKHSACENTEAAFINFI